MEQVSLNNPKTYFDLICKVGSKGPYQRNIFIIFCLNWFSAGMLLMGTSFLFMNPIFDCPANGINTTNCEQTICSMNPTLWLGYLQTPQVSSLATEFGPYMCGDLVTLDALRMILYIGTFVGYMTFLCITDNFGRKFSSIITWSVTCVGVILICAAQSMAMACVGLFLAGAGCESSIRITMAIFGEIVDYYRRQEYSVALQIAFGFSGVAIGLIYWWLRAWREVTIYFCLIPCLLCLLCLIFYLEETPKFLITKQGLDKAMKSLNRIGKINLGRQNIITYEDVLRVYEQQELGGNKFAITITPYHLFKYKSLRRNTITCSLIFLFITYLYFGPMIIVANLGINPFLAQILVSSSELLAYPFAYCFIKKLPRITTGYVCFALSAVFSFILIFVNPPQGCQGCPQVIVQAIFIFASRFVVSFYFSVFFLYVTEIFPLRARGLGFGISSAAGAIASSSGQFIFTEMEQKQISPMILFTVFAVLSMIVLCFQKQTLNKPLENEIKEIQALKDAQKQDIDQKSHRSGLSDVRGQSIQLSVKLSSSDGTG